MGGEGAGGAEELGAVPAAHHLDGQRSQGAGRFRLAGAMRFQNDGRRPAPAIAKTSRGKWGGRVISVHRRGFLLGLFVIGACAPGAAIPAGSRILNAHNALDYLAPCIGVG